MDAIRVAKVDNVWYIKPGQRIDGTLHLTAHHIIFHASEPSGDEETWIPYPLISTVVRLPQSLQGKSPLAFRSRTFEYFSLVFSSNRDALDVFESVKELTVSPSVYSLYAFFYQPNPPLPTNEGWSLYSPREEFARMGVGSRTKAWRFTDINKDYTICPTYPGRLVVPAKISDSVLSYAAKYRSKARVPSLVYLHWNNHASITRSSQPTVGLTNSRSIQDEKLVEAIFQSHHVVNSPFAPAPPRLPGGVYGATATNLIIDARSAIGGVANVARGGGTENMDYYKDGRKVYLGVENIHVMRDSLAKVAEALRDADAAFPVSADGFEDTRQSGILDRQALRRSGWLKHISALLDGANIIVRNIHINSSHVLIHCSDGWDRTAQLSTLAQLCLDPYFRTYRGFQILVEKDWVSFGHRFTDRCGHLSSEKFFLTPSSDGPVDGPQTFLASVQNKFASPSHLKETSPVFHQFLECVRQIQRQFPTRFEFNERYLERLHYHLYSCQFGTFLFNNERERRTVGEGSSQPAYLRTHSVWDLMNSETERARLTNPDYDPSLDAREGKHTLSSDLGVLLPNPKDIRFWHELYGRTDEEMNGRIVNDTPEAGGANMYGPVDRSVDDPIVPNTPSRQAIIIPVESTASNTPDSPSIKASVSLPPIPRTPSPRSEVFRPFSGSSAFSLRPSPLPGDAGRSSPVASSPTRKSTSAGLGNVAAGGFKSMWAQLSSNAAVALSAVQDVYDGATKDLVGGGSVASGVAPGTREQGGELQDTSIFRADPEWASSSLAGADGWKTSGSDHDSRSSRSWATSSIGPQRPNPRPSLLDLDDPWSNSGSVEREVSSPISGVQDRLGELTLPVDPTISFPGGPPSPHPPRRDSTPTFDNLKPPSPIVSRTPSSNSFVSISNPSGSRVSPTNKVDSTVIVSPFLKSHTSDSNSTFVTTDPGVPLPADPGGKELDPLGVGFLG